MHSKTFKSYHLTQHRALEKSYHMKLSVTLSETPQTSRTGLSCSVHLIWKLWSPFAFRIAVRIAGRLPRLPPPPLFFFERELDLAEEMRVFKTALETCSLKITYSANLSSYAKIQMGFGSEFRQSALYRRAHPVLCCLTGLDSYLKIYHINIRRM